MLFAYLGPDTVLPLTSAFAAAAGVVLMFGRLFWRSACLGLAWCGRLVGVTSQAASAPTRRADVAHLVVTRPISRPRRAAARTEHVEQ